MFQNRLNQQAPFQVAFKGEPELSCKEVFVGQTFSVCPQLLPYIKPKLVVKQGDRVKKGQPLFFDKKNPNVYVHSPHSGIVSGIKYGSQRSLEQIAFDKTDDAPIEFSPLPKKPSRTDAVSWCLERGLWQLFRQFPFHQIPSSEDIPPAIVVQLSNTEPFHPKLSAVLEQYDDQLLKGLAFLTALCPTVIAYADADEKMNLDLVSEMMPLHRISGGYPSMDPASVLYAIKTDASLNRAWYCDWNTVLKLGESLITNQYPSRQVICMGGNYSDLNCHYIVDDGIARQDVVSIERNDAERIIYGGVFKGLHHCSLDYLPMGASAINVIDSDPQTEFVSFMQIGLNKPSHSTAYLSGILSRFMPVKTNPTTAVNGSVRDCVSCGYCESVCPVDLMPQMLLRNVESEDIEESMRVGLLDCSECGACTYVCPSKIDLSSAFSMAKQQLYKEAMQS